MSTTYESDKIIVEFDRRVRFTCPISHNACDASPECTQQSRIRPEPQDLKGSEPEWSILKYAKIAISMSMQFFSLRQAFCVCAHHCLRIGHVDSACRGSLSTIIINLRWRVNFDLSLCRNAFTWLRPLWFS